MSIEEYNEMTPKELWFYVQAFNERVKRESEEKLAIAYMISAWHPMRLKILPKLEELLSGSNKKPQTDEKLLAQIKAVNAAMGGNIRYIERGDEVGSG